MLLVDGHLDLSMNALEWNRDLTRPLVEVRRRETGQTDGLAIYAYDACQAQFTQQLPQIKQSATTKKPQR